ncbi:hypothetical protein LTR09_009805 [Extremus antarcticus]|uniref:Uncharacterized protein n=1 Tax=Extremus antarcticus TaxID=702011 RepID=A0AAJ0G974_9PEZI|nr:hypothetical protein LTR09_009805 [Extremus antarcticus]
MVLRPPPAYAGAADPNFSPPNYSRGLFSNYRANSKSAPVDIELGQASASAAPASQPAAPAAQPAREVAAAPVVKRSCAPPGGKRACCLVILVVVAFFAGLLLLLWGIGTLGPSAPDCRDYPNNEGCVVYRR